MPKIICSIICVVWLCAAAATLIFYWGRILFKVGDGPIWRTGLILGTAFTLAGAVFGLLQFKCDLISKH